MPRTKVACGDFAVRVSHIAILVADGRLAVLKKNKKIKKWGY